LGSPRGRARILLNLKSKIRNLKCRFSPAHFVRTDAEVRYGIGLS
jgi:hypothetical protein